MVKIKKTAQQTINDYKAKKALELLMNNIESTPNVNCWAKN